MTHFFWPIDGSIVGLYLLGTMIVGLMVRRYVGKVEHFLVAGREMNVYLGIASLAATEFGIVTCMYTAQAGYKYGFAGAIPGITNAVVMWLIGFSGFGIKPLRDAGVMTIPELFQQRYGSFVRWLSGVVIVLGGLLNMGVFLRVGGEFLIVCCGLGQQDPETADRMIKITMTVLLVLVATYTILGGMLSVLITDFLQFVIMSGGLIAVSVLVLTQVGWTEITDAVIRKHAAGGLNPFVHPDLGWQFVLSNTLTSAAAVLTWQTVISRVLAAKDSRTGRRVYTGTSFFFVCRWVLPGLWAMAAIAVPFVTDERLGEIAKLFGHAPDQASLYAMPLLLSQLLPIGLMGILVAAMLAAEMSTDSSYMLTWGGVIYNDILAPLRRREPWTERRGILVNRFIVACIGGFLLFWGLWYKLEGNLWEYLQTTGTIYLAAMSTLLVACCYWRRANDWGAISAIIVGAALPVIALSANLFCKIDIPGPDGALQSIGWAKHYIGDAWVNIGTYVCVWIAMVAGSLAKPPAPVPALEAVR